MCLKSHQPILWGWLVGGLWGHCPPVKALMRVNKEVITHLVNDRGFNLRLWLYRKRLRGQLKLESEPQNRQEDDLSTLRGAVQWDIRCLHQWNQRVSGPSPPGQRCQFQRGTIRKALPGPHATSDALRKAKGPQTFRGVRGPSDHNPSPEA